MSKEYTLADFTDIFDYSTGWFSDSSICSLFYQIFKRFPSMKMVKYKVNQDFLKEIKELYQQDDAFDIFEHVYCNHFENEKEEEEEEEEIPDINDMAALREEIKAGFAVARDENKKMAEQLNDVMDASVSALNKTTEESRLALEKLAQAVRDTDRLDKQDKEVLEKKIGELQVRQQRLADRMIAVAESAKEEYNLEYQNKIADGIDNYEKVIECYLRGDASREEVISAGEKLKEDAALLNVAPDKGIIAELNKEAEILKSEFAAMAAEIKKTEKKGKETVN